jgi:hypothetical protein
MTTWKRLSNRDKTILAFAAAPFLGMVLGLLIVAVAAL